MNKEEIIKQITADGYSTDFSLSNDCLYCSATDETYLFENFDVVMKYNFTENGQNKKLRTVKSTEYDLTGYYII